MELSKDEEKTMRGTMSLGNTSFVSCFHRVFLSVTLCLSLSLSLSLDGSGLLLLLFITDKSEESTAADIP